jgi:hypothetical protein
LAGKQEQTGETYDKAGKGGPRAGDSDTDYDFATKGRVESDYALAASGNRQGGEDEAAYALAGTGGARADYNAAAKGPTDLDYSVAKPTLSGLQDTGYLDSEELDYDVHTTTLASDDLQNESEDIVPTVKLDSPAALNSTEIPRSDQLKGTNNTNGREHHGSALSSIPGSVDEVA